MNGRTSLVVLTLCGTLFLQAQTYESANGQMDKFVRTGIELWGVPGLSVAVIKDGEVVFSRGYGVTSLDGGTPVDEQSMFMIGSTTKAITAAALGILVDEGKLTWDDRVSEHLPEFQLKDPYISANLTIRDLLTHRAGFPGTDFLWLANFDEDEILYQMRFANTAYGFRDGWIYQNIMWAVAGKLVEKISGIPWTDFVQDRIFNPLGMTRSVPKENQLQHFTNYVEPHYKVDGEVQVIDKMNAGLIAPAGDIWASIEDMARWTSMMVDSGRANGKQILSTKTWEQLLTPQTVIPKRSFSYPTIKITKPFWTTYAMGWFQHDYRGIPLSFHTDSLAGLIAMIGIIPEERFGVYVLGNLDHAEVRHAILYKAIDLYVHGDNGREWNDEVFDLYEQIRKTNETRSKAFIAKRIEGTKPTHVPADFTGTYTSELYGDAEVKIVDGELNFEFGQIFVGKLTHWHYNTFEITWDRTYMDKGYLSFDSDVTGVIRQIQIFGGVFRRRSH